MVYYRFPGHNWNTSQSCWPEEGLFDSLVQCTSKSTWPTPALYTSLSQDGVGPPQRFIEVIRESVLEFEDELPPSFDGLWHHWQRICWVFNM